MSLLQTAKAAGLNPNDYFKDVFLRIFERGVTVKDLTLTAGRNDSHLGWLRDGATFFRGWSAPRKPAGRV